MALHEVRDLSDPRLEPFRDIRGRNWTEQSGLFIAEGPLVVEQLLRSDYPCRSVLLDRKFHDHYADMLAKVEDVFLIEHDAIEQVVGFHFHRGVLACGLRQPVRTVQNEFDAPAAFQETLVAVAGVQDPENLGAILRCCAGLGVLRVIVGPDSCDPWSRRALRVAMGTGLSLQIFRSRDLAADVRWLAEQYGVRSYATSLAAEALPLEQVRREGPSLLLFGNERNGLGESVLKAAHQRVQIAMDQGVDSLNVAAAAAIFVHYFTRLSDRE